MKYLSILFFLMSLFVFSQNQTNGIIIDKSTKKPISKVAIYNNDDSTITNDDGYFIFNSNSDSIIISKLGYEELKSNFKELKNIDTIFLSYKETFLLDEATIVSYPKLLNTVYQNIEKNYPHTSFIDVFFLRTILKRNKEIYRFEDIQGKIKRNTLFLSSDIKTVDFDFQILNQRKAGLALKPKMTEEIEFHKLIDLFKFFSSTFINLKGFSFSYENIDENYIKASFRPLPNFNNLNLGYYIIDKRDNSIKEYFIEVNPEFYEGVEFTKRNGINYRTTKNELFVRFTKNTKIGKYCISDATLKQKLEVFGKSNKKTEYDIEYQLVNVENFNNETFTSNIKNSKRLFEINYNYNELFWENQNQLLLTDELESFINSSQADTKQFKVISNIKEKK